MTSPPEPASRLRRPRAWRRLGRALARLGLYAFTVGGALVMLVPFAWMLLTSLKRGDEVFRFPITALPEHPLWSNYVRAVTVVPFGRGLLNTLLLVLPPLAVGLSVTALAAYSFARLRFPGRDALFAILLGTMMIPGVVTVVPLFILFPALN